MARVTVEDCTDKIPNRFELCAIASHRAKNIGAGAPVTIEKDNDKISVIALREIAAGNIDIPGIREELITNLQTKNKVDVIEREENLYAEAQEDVQEDDYNAQSTEIFVSESHSDLELESEQIYKDNIIGEDK